MAALWDFVSTELAASELPWLNHPLYCPVLPCTALYCSNLLPWIQDFMGVCRTWNPAAQYNDPATEGPGTLGGDAELSSPTRAHSPPKLQMAPSFAAHVGGGGLSRAMSIAHLNNPLDALEARSNKAGDGGKSVVGVRASTAALRGRKSRVNALHMGSGAPPIKELQPQLAKIISTQNVTLLQRSLPPDVVQVGLAVYCALPDVGCGAVLYTRAM